MKLLMENWRNFINEEEKEEELSQEEMLLNLFLTSGEILPSGEEATEKQAIELANTLGIDLFKDIIDTDRFKDKIEKKLLKKYNTGLVEENPVARGEVLRKARKVKINIGDVVKDYKKKILDMIYNKEVAKAIELYKSVGMGNLLTDTNLTNVDLRNVDLSGANLTNASLTKANLSGANLRGAILGETDLFRTNLSGADLSDADLTYATGINTAIGIAPEDIQNKPELYKNTKWPEDFYHEDY